MTRRQRGRDLVIAALILAAGFAVILAAGDSSASMHGLVGLLLRAGRAGLVAGGILVLAGALGRGLRHRAAPALVLGDGVADACLDLALGIAALVLAATALAAAGLLRRPGALALLLAAAIAAAWTSTPARLRPAAEGGSPPSGWTVAAWLLGGGLLLPTLFAALAPPTGPDELQYHLRLVTELLTSGKLPGAIDDPVTGFPLGMHALLALVQAVDGQGALRPFTWLLGLAGLVAGQRLTVASFGPAAGAVYVPVACGAASVVRFLPTVNTDTPQALFLVTATAVVLARGWPLSRRVVVLGVLMGAALAIKTNAGVFFAPLVVLAAAAEARNPQPGRARRAGLIAAAGLIALPFVVPFWVKNALVAGHPLYPIAGMDFPPGLERAFRFNFTENYGAGAGVLAWARSPWDLFVLGREFDRRHFLGRLNLWPLIATPGVALLLLRRSRPGVLLLGTTAAGFALWAGPMRRVVYLLPLWPLLAALAAGGLAALGGRLAHRSASLAAAGLVLAAVAAAEVAPAWGDLLADLDVATGSETPEHYLATRVDSTRVEEWIAAHVPRSEPIAAFYMWSIPATGNPVRWACAEDCSPLRLAALRAGSAEGLRDALEADGIRWIVSKRAVFLRSGYPGLTDEEFAAGFERPAAIVDDLLTRFATRRFAHGEYSVHEIVSFGQ